MSQKKITEINHALVEEKRPPLYTSMKYWGKKPHNIWNEYISCYTPKDGIYLDPFSGSAMSAFECFVAGKKAVAFDINPLTSFVIETICSDFNKEEYINAVNQIVNIIEKSDTYNKLYRYRNNYEDYYIHNIKWENGQIYEVCLESLDGNDRICLTPDIEDYSSVEFSNTLSIEGAKPIRKFRKSDSFSKSFTEKVGVYYADLYTKRNLWVLSNIFDNILLLENESLKKQLLFTFIQIVHLSTKMCVPRSKKTNRDFSTSWGRSAFIYAKKQMEMNPLLLFKKSCYEKQSTVKCLEFAKTYFKRKPVIADINVEDFSLDKNVDIWYGVVDVKSIDDVLPHSTIDFILTDPPYGGLVQYLDLSTVWLSWLELYNDKYCPHYNEEITVNGNKDQLYFEQSMTKALQKLNYVLKDNGKLVLTFNNNDVKVWSSLLKAIENSGFRIEKVIHQQNKRTGESNVRDPYGMSASDFYLRCIKTNEKYLVNYNKDVLEKILIDKAIEIIRERHEPTPYQILFNGLLAKMSISNADISSFDNDIKSILFRHLEKELCIYKDATNCAGNYWWINGVKYNSLSKETLTFRVEKFIRNIFIKNEEITNIDILRMIFKKYPNGLTPDIEIVYKILNKYATLKNEFWIRK